MILRRSHYLIAGAALASSIICLFAFPGTAQTPASGTSKMMLPHERIENQAALVNTNDQQSVRALANEVFNFPRAFPRLPDAIANIVKDRLVRAETKYLRGEGPGVQEREVALLLNDLASRFGAPAYAQTSPQQVRVLRMSLLLSAPVFMGRGMTPDHAQVGDSINPTMSPLQATHLLATLIDQKLLNPDYQIPPAEWDSNHYQSSLAKMQRIQELKQSGEFRSRLAATIRENPRRVEMRQVLSREISSMSLTNAIELVNQAFATLKIEN